MNKINQAYIELDSGKWQNEETGLVRHFTYPPTRGKWKRISRDRRELPIINDVIWWV